MCKMESFGLLLLLLFVSPLLVNGKEYLPIEPVKDFQEEKFLGIWYVVSTDTFKYYPSRKCTKCNFVIHDENTINANCTSFDTNNGKLKNLDAYLKYMKDHTIGYFWQETSTQGIDDFLLNKIIAITYDEFLIFYISQRKKESTYILTRNRNVDDDYLKKIHGILDEKGLTPDKLGTFQRINQDNCKN